MADITLSFDTGERSLELTDGRGHSVEVRFNPYDIMFLNVLVGAAEKLDAEQGKLKNIGTENWAAVYEASVEADKRMREILDGIFDAPICEALFPNQTVYAIGNGFPAWSNFLHAIVDKMDVGLSAEKEAAQKRIRKYSEKYRR